MAPIIDINNADFVSLSHLTVANGQMGVHVRNGSTDFVADHLTLSNNFGNGLTVDSSSNATDLTHIHALNNSGHGISVSSAIDTLSSSSVHDNDGMGVLLSNAGTVRVEANEIYNNRGVGLSITGGLPDTPAVVGNEDLSLGLGNIIRDNTADGLVASGNVLISGNAVHGHSSNPGMFIRNGATAQWNVVHSNFNGIESGRDFFGDSPGKYHK